MLQAFPRHRFSTRRLLGAAALLAALSGIASPLLADAPGDDKETTISAKQMHSDQATGIVTATGMVEIAHAGYILHADKVTYDQKSGVMHAEGHVAMLTPSGDVQFADSEDVTGDMKQSFVRNLSILFPDSSRLSAKNGQRFDGRYMVADQGVYTACNVCKENPENPPLWQLRADKIVHDNEEHEIYYHNATLDMAGIPVFYTPYLSSPDPTVDRRQGFLTPTPGYSPDLGTMVRTPYYVDIAPDKDLTISPLFASTAGEQLEAIYREQFAQGGLQVTGSFTRAKIAFNDPNADQNLYWRGHFNSQFRYNIDNNWRAGSDIAFASDKTYMALYRYGNPNELTTHNFVEGFSGRNYVDISQYNFEDLRSGTTTAQPIVLPRTTFSVMGEPGQTFGGRWALNGNMLVTTRDSANQALWQQGPNTRRAMVNGDWDRRIISSSTGLVTDLSALLHLDAYSADNVISADQSKTYNNVSFGRHFEQASAKIGYPVSRSGEGYIQTLEPMVAFTAAPNFYNSVKIPLEDGQDVSFDETNLFSPNRFTGYDRIEGGSRATYGLRQVLTTDSGGRVDIFGGQSYDFTGYSSFGSYSGLDSHASDYVGRIAASPNSYMNLDYSFRLDRENMQLQRQFGSLSVGVPRFRPYVRYVSGYSQDTSNALVKIDDGAIGFDTNFAKYWDFHLEHTQGFDPNPGPRSTQGTISYMDECFMTALTVSQDDTGKIGFTTGTSVLVHFYLRNLGGFHTDGTTTGGFRDSFRQGE